MAKESSLFRELEIEAFRAGITPRTKESIKWFRDKARELFRGRRMKNREEIFDDDALTQCIKEYCIKYKIINSSFGINQKLLSHFFPNSKDNKYFYGRNALTEAGNLICSRVLIYNTFLNDIEEGGEINFLWQKVKVKPKKGLTLLWPSEFTHAYTHLPAPKENKYLISGFINYI